jgi:hypothetical protein
MTRTLALVAIALVGVLAVSAAAPAVGEVAIGTELAEAQKPGGGGGNTASKAGENLADLISDMVGPVLVVLVGVFALLAFSQRSIGMAITAVIVGLFAGLFILDPKSAEDMFKDVYDSVFG